MFGLLLNIIFPNIMKRGYRDSIPTLIERKLDYDMPAVQQARNKIFSQSSNVSLSMSQLASSLCPILSQNSQQQDEQGPSNQHLSQQLSSQQILSPNNSQEVPEQQSIRSSRSSSKRSRDSGVVTMQPSTTQSNSSANSPPKKKVKRTGRRPFDIYQGTKPLSAGEANQSRTVSSRRHSIEVSIN